MTKQEALNKIEELKKFVEGSDKPKVDPLARHKNPRKGDLFHLDDGAVFMVCAKVDHGWSLAALKAPDSHVGLYYRHGCGFDRDEKRFTFIGNANENPNLITINVPS